VIRDAKISGKGWQEKKQHKRSTHIRTSGHQSVMASQNSAEEEEEEEAEKAKPSAVPHPFLALASLFFGTVFPMDPGPRS